MIYTSASYTNPEHTQVTGADARRLSEKEAVTLTALLKAPPVKSRKRVKALEVSNAG